MNPELRRNLWLEISMHRLIAMPAVLGLGFVVIASLGKSDWREGVAWTAAMVFFALTLFWGARLAGEAISDEVRGKTWDLQRMSAIPPWSMTWGKLLGATLFTWYGGLICLMAFLYASLSMSAPRFGGIKGVIALAACGVLLHAAAMAATLQAAQKGWVATNRWSTFMLVLLLLMIGPGLSSFATQNEMLSWYGIEMAHLDFITASLVVFAAWAVFGAYRAMCQELQLRTTPWAWGAFALFLTGYFAGFALSRPSASGNALSYVCVSGLMVSSVLTYIILFSEPTGPMVLRRILLRLRVRQWRRVFEEMPCWPVTFALSVLFALGSMTAAGTLETGSDDWLHKAAAMPLVFVFLLARDIAILLFFSFAKQARRAEATAVLYIVLLYWLLPGIFNMMDLNVVAEIILPVLMDSAMGILVAALQAAGVIALCVARWRRNFAGEKNGGMVSAA